MENLDKFARWFIDNPDKILGEVKTHKGTKYDKDKVYTTIIGDKEKLFSLDIPDYMQVSNEDPLVSTEKVVINETNATPSEVANIDTALTKSKKRIDKKRETKLSPDFSPSENIWSYDEVDEEYNGARYDKDGNLISKAITEAEKQAYVLYIKRFTGKPIQGGFQKYDIQDNPSNIKMLMKKGVLCFDNTENEERRRYKPTFYYASGNIRKKNQALVKDKDFYVSNFGEDVYENHLNAIKDALSKVNDNKLTLAGADKSKRIFIRIDGKFAEDFKVSPCVPIDEKSFDRSWTSWIRKDDGKIEWKVNETAKGYVPESRNGRNAYFGDYKLTLKEAFIFWYTDFSQYTASDYNIIYPSGVNYDLVMKFFVNGKYNANNKKAIPENYLSGVGKETIIKDSWYVKLQEIKDIGNELFALFLEKGLQEVDRIGIENVWNQQYNGLLNFDVNRVPILFQFVKNVGVGTMDIRPEKRRALGFNMLTGSSCLAYGVGMGKTFCSIFTIGQNLDMGLCKRPLIIVPNSVYPQFLQEIKMLLPQYKVNGLYNLRSIYSELAKEVEDNSITIISASALGILGFKDNETGRKLYKRYEGIIEQGMDEENLDKRGEREKSRIAQKTAEFVGLAQSETEVFFDEIGWDYLVVDEAHNYKNLFASVKARINEETGKREKSSGYTITGSVSIEAIKLFSIAQYVQMKSPNGNCLLLTATPFTNTPLEIYAMLSLVRYDFLKANGFGSMADFFDFFADIGTISAVTTTLQPINKQVVKGFRNVVAMQGLIYSLIDKPTKEEEASKVRRPNKVVLPLWDKRIGEENIKVSDSNQVTTLLKMSGEQQELWQRLESYGEGKMTYEQLSDQEYWNNTKCGSIKAMLKKAQKDAEEGNRADYNAGGIRSVFALTYGRTIALSPYFYRFAPYDKDPTPAEFVQSSPKIEYAIECIKSVKEHHEKTKTPMSGQVIFMTKGTNCFNLITDYCVEYLGLKEHEVGIIASENFIGKKKQKGKDAVQDAFLGRRLDITDPKNPKYVSIPDEDRIKVLVGSNSIKEGVNLQFYSTCLYVCEVDWNPTDMTQLEGRIWRQKNAFANVRIVIPLLENSLDAFIYSKLQEKTGRINQIWERDGKNEFDLDDFDPEEMTRQVSRNPKQIADLIKKEKVKEITEKLTEQTTEYNGMREVRKISGNIIDKYNDLKNYNNRYRTSNPLQAVWNFLNFFRPSLIDKPLVRDEDLLFRPTSLQEGRQLRVNPDALNYSFEDLTELMNVFRKDAIIEYPRGYKTGWKEEKDKPLPKFEVGEKVKFSTRRGDKEGVILEVLNPSASAEMRSYDIDLGGDNVAEDITLNENNMESLDNPIVVLDNFDLSGKELKLGSKKSIEELRDVFDWAESLRYNLDTDYKSLNFFGKDYYETPFKPLLSFWNKEKVIESFNSFAKVKDYFTDEYLKGNYYGLEWSRWVRENDEYWKKYLIPLGIKNEDQLTEKLTKFREDIALLTDKLKSIDGKEYEEELIKEAEIEIKEREQLGDKPLSPLEASILFAKPNPDYLGNELLDIFDEKYLEEKTGKKVVKEQKKEIKEQKEEVKELSIFDKKLKLLNLMVMTAEGEQKSLIEKKIKLLNLMKMAS